MTIIAFDPGVKNFAYSILTTEQPTILSGHLNNPIFSIKEADVKNSVALFLWEIGELLNRVNYKESDGLVIERYQSRGGYKNSQIELVNVMLGALLAHYDALPILPTTWKSYMKRVYGTNDMLYLLQNSQLSPHMADATGMAIYYAEKHGSSNRLVDSLKSVMWSWTLESTSGRT